METNTWDLYREIWRLQGPSVDYSAFKIDSKINPLFSHVLTESNSVIGVVDRQTMSYLYISENVKEIMDYDACNFLEKGVSYGFSKIVPEL